jgi:hypothetical protein
LAFDFMKWFKIMVHDTAVADGALKTITDAFDRVMPLGEASKGCAIFKTIEPDASVVFNSPEFAAIAPGFLESFSASECDAPPPRREGEEFGTALLLASDSAVAWSLLG